MVNNISDGAEIKENSLITQNQGNIFDFPKENIIFAPELIKLFKFMIKGVITGDLVNSTNIAAEWRQSVLDALNVCVADFLPLTLCNLEMYRGDSFQIVVDKPDYALAVAIALRAKLKAMTPGKLQLWDARLSIGIGDISFESDNIVTSDGEAFRLSGRSFDNIGKKRLSISTTWPDFNKDMQGRRIKLRCPPKVLTGTLHPSLPSIFSG